MRIVIGVSEMQVTEDSLATIVTYALGSCIGLTVWDPVVKVGGMLHFLLPDSKLSPEKAKTNPYMFCDTGIPKLFRKVYQLGAKKNRLQIKAAGGAGMLDSNETFNIGKKNSLALRKIFWKNNVILDAEDVGGTEPRNLQLDIATGRVTISTKCRKEREL